MKKMIALMISITIAVAAILDGYFLFFHTSKADTTGSTTSSSTDNIVSTTSASSSTSGGTLKDGTYTGSDSSYEFGDIQVQIVVANGKISKVTAIKYPTDNQKTQSINENAIPTYEASAVKSQSASFSNISGATKTWEAFTESLKTAINDAG